MLSGCDYTESPDGRKIKSCTQTENLRVTKYMKPEAWATALKGRNMRGPVSKWALVRNTFLLFLPGA